MYDNDHRNYPSIKPEFLSAEPPVEGFKGLRFRNRKMIRRRLSPWQRLRSLFGIDLLNSYSRDKGWSEFRSGWWYGFEIRSESESFDDFRKRKSFGDVEIDA
jgi:hypothetical protein